MNHGHPRCRVSARARILSLVLIALTTASAVAPASPGHPEGDAVSMEPIHAPGTLSTRLDSLGHQIMDRGAVVGLAIAVAHRDRVLYENGFGHIDSTRSVPVDSSGVFLLASVSKLIGATVVMKLIEEGRLNLDDPLAELLPWFPDVEQARRITVRHLLTHTSGLQDYAAVIDSVYLDTRVDPDRDDFMEFFRTHDLDFAPGTDFNYSNSGYYLLPLIVEQVTGRTFEDELDRIVNRPAGIGLAMIRERVDDPHLTQVFELADSTLDHLAHWPWIRGDGGLTATAGDLVRFPFAWATRIVSEDTFDAMCAPAVLPDGTPTGYGLGVRTGRFEGERVVGHTGGNRTTLAVMKYYPDLQIATVVLVNVDGTPTDALYIEGYVSLEVLGKDEPDLEALEIRSEPLDRFLGEYAEHGNHYASGRPLELVRHADDPHVHRRYVGSDSRGQRLYYLGDDTFGYDPYPMDRIIFVTDRDGHVVAFNSFWNGLKKGGLYRKTR